jgi:hypothetical protein
VNVESRTTGYSVVPRVFRALLFAVLASVLLGPCAYFQGLWPQRLNVMVEGPASWRLVRVGQSTCNEALPSLASKYLSMWPTGEEVTADLEVSHGGERARCRVRALNHGGFITGHQALPRAAESLDGSLWSMGDFCVTVHPAVPGHVWFGCDSWGRTVLQVDGSPRERTDAHAYSLPGDTSWHEVVADNWTLSFLADAGTAVHVREWGSPRETLLRCDEAGFKAGTLAVDGAPPRPIAIDRTVRVEGKEFELRLEAGDGHRAHVRFKTGDLSATIRVSR